MQVFIQRPIHPVSFPDIFISLNLKFVKVSILSET